MALVVGTNSYISVVNATTYFTTRLYSTAWTSASADDKTASLLMACRNINRLRFKGVKKNASQTLDFPRCYCSQSFGNQLEEAVINLPEDFGIGWFCEAAVPQAVIDAQCEEALALLAYGNDTRRRLQQAGVRSFSLGSLSESYGSPVSNITAGLQSVEAKDLLREYLAGAVVMI